MNDCWWRLVIHLLHHQALFDVFGGAFEIAKTVLCVSENGGNLFTLISDNISTFGRNKKLATLVFWKKIIPLRLQSQILMLR